MPWREFRWHRGQQHYSGLYWSATTGGHVAYESRLELSRLIPADFDPGTVGIVAQPFLLEQDGRRHVPDFLLVDVDGIVTIVNVKPAERLARPKVKEALGWATGLFESRGWRSEVWSGTDPVAMANVRFLAGYRRQVQQRLTQLSDPLEDLAVAQRLFAVTHAKTSCLPGGRSRGIARPSRWVRSGAAW